VAKSTVIELFDGTRIPILYEDRSVLALDKPAGWMLGPEDEEHARRNLHLALLDGIAAGEWWAKSRGLKFVRFLHRLDAPTTGILLFSKSPGAVPAYSRLFATRDVHKTYFAVTEGLPHEAEWTCRLPLGPTAHTPGRHQVDQRQGKEAETGFRVLATKAGRALIEARPHTGRTHQIRLHLLAAGCPIMGDVLYGRPAPTGLALRAVELSFRCPFTRRPIRIQAPTAAFRAQLGFGEEKPVPATTISVPAETKRQKPRPPAA
jgi:23S rRNA pseudouridine1911/1915/1917 synthase